MAETNVVQAKGFFDPANVSGAVIWGVVAAVLATGLLLFLGLIVRNIIAPAVLRWKYKGVKLQGLWVQEAAYGSVRNHWQWDLVQDATKISGNVTLTSADRNNPAHDYIQKFFATGSIWEGFIVLNLRATDEARLAFATALLKITERGEGLIGHVVYRSRAKDEAATEPMHWQKRPT